MSRLASRCRISFGWLGTTVAYPRHPLQQAYAAPLKLPPPRVAPQPPGSPTGLANCRSMGEATSCTLTCKWGCLGHEEPGGAISSRVGRDGSLEQVSPNGEGNGNMRVLSMKSYPRKRHRSGKPMGDTERPAGVHRLSEPVRRDAASPGGPQDILQPLRQASPG